MNDPVTSDSSTKQLQFPPSGWISWLLGIAVLFAVVIAVRQFSEEKAFVRLAREAKPLWVLAALTLQAATYLAQGEIWRTVGRMAGTVLARPLVYKLALAKLFFDQALPSAGLSGSIVVAKELEEQGALTPIGGSRRRSDQHHLVLHRIRDCIGRSDHGIVPFGARKLCGRLRFGTIHIPQCGAGRWNAGVCG